MFGKEGLGTEANQKIIHEAAEYDKAKMELKILNCKEIETFPKSIFEFAKIHKIKILNMSGCKMSELPENFGRQLKDLEILFLSDNKFEIFPELSECEKLYMVAFKSCGMKKIKEDSFPKALKWLILTDNLITSLPRSIGNCKDLKKVALVGNKLVSLPEEMQSCRDIELLRFSVNDLEILPTWIPTLPKLAYFSDTDNPYSLKPENTSEDLTIYQTQDINVFKELSGSPSSRVFVAKINGIEEEVLIKVFRSGITSDGYPESDMNFSLLFRDTENVNRAVGKVKMFFHDGEIYENVLVFKKLQDNYKNIGSPPNFQTISRDSFGENQKYTLDQVLQIIKSVAMVAKNLHSRNVMHGDLYAHNIMCDQNGNAVVLDFGAASMYKNENKPALERVEVRAFGYLIEDLLENIKVPNDTEIYGFLKNLKEMCILDKTLERPTFSEIARMF